MRSNAIGFRNCVPIYFLRAFDASNNRQDLIKAFLPSACSQRRPPGPLYSLLGLTERAGDARQNYWLVKTRIRSIFYDPVITPRKHRKIMRGWREYTRAAARIGESDKDSRIRSRSSSPDWNGGNHRKSRNEGDRETEERRERGADKEKRELEGDLHCGCRVCTCVRVYVCTYGNESLNTWSFTGPARIYRIAELQNSHEGSGFVSRHFAEPPKRDDTPRYSELWPVR